MPDIKEGIRYTDADTKDVETQEESSRDDIVEDMDADTKDNMKRFDDIDSSLERITRAIEALANGLVKGSSKVENSEPTDSQPDMKRIEDLNL